jgi:hypothetical protein
MGEKQGSRIQLIQQFQGEDGHEEHADMAEDDHRRVDR